MKSRPMFNVAMAMCLVGGCFSAFTNPSLPAQQPPGGAVPSTAGSGWDPYSPINQTGLIASPFSLPSPGTLFVPVADGLGERLWLRVEYLYWKTEGMSTPPLVTTSPDGTPQDQAAILGEPGVAVLFGGGEINDGGTDGLRARGGFWFGRDTAFGLEGEWFGLREQTDGFSASGDGTPILGRPFFDITNDRQTAQLVSFPNVVRGDVAVASKSRFDSYLINARIALLPHCVTAPPGCPEPDRVDWIVGYRHLDLEDDLAVGERLESLVSNVPGTIQLAEAFRTSNRFDGLQLGVTRQANFRWFWIESMLRVAIGNNRQEVSIAGGTSITELGVTESFTGGILAQRSNIGNRQRDQFTMVPEVGVTVGLRLTSWLDATAGYSLIYFPNVVRAGDQIDTDVNPNLIPEESVPLTGSLRPRFRFVESDYWAHGVSVGGQIRF